MTFPLGKKRAQMGNYELCLLHLTVGNYLQSSNLTFNFMPQTRAGQMLSDAQDKYWSRFTHLLSRPSSILFSSVLVAGRRYILLVVWS